MGLLGDVLEVLHRDDAQPTVVATIEGSHDRDAERETEDASPWREKVHVPLRLRLLAAPVRVRPRRRRFDGPRAPWDQQSLRVWFDAPRRARVDQTWDGQHLATIGEDFWEAGGRDERTYDLVSGAWLDHPRAAGCDELATHFWRPRLRSIAGAVAFVDEREDEHAGRAVVRARARRRPDGMGLWPHWLGPGTDFDLVFDREHGHLLSFTTLRAGRVLGGRAVTSVAYGVPIDDGVWNPSGE